MAQMYFKICFVIPSGSFRTPPPPKKKTTDTKFKYSLELGEGFRAGTVSRVSRRSHETTICPSFIIWHISIAYFGKILFQVIA